MNGPPERCLFDTNAVVSLLRGHGELLALTRQARWVGISIVTEIEFRAFPDLAPEDARLFAEFAERISVVDLAHHDAALLDRVIALRQNQRLRLPDAVVVASALAHGAALVTADRQLLGLEGRIEALRTLAFSP
jgi:predicted nucleic acid-binding protein